MQHKRQYICRRAKISQRSSDVPTSISSAPRAVLTFLVRRRIRFSLSQLLINLLLQKLFPLVQREQLLAQTDDRVSGGLTVVFPTCEVGHPA